MDPEGSFAWSLRKVTQVILLLLYILFVYNKETRLGPDMIILYVYDVHV